MPRLIIERKRELVNMSRKYVIYVDGKKKASIANGKKVEIKVEPGAHQLEARMDEFSSAPQEVKLIKGEEFRLEVQSFRFSNWILPSLMVLAPLFYFLSSNERLHPLVGIVVVGSILVYAFYHYFFAKRRYLRLQKS